MGSSPPSRIVIVEKNMKTWQIDTAVIAIVQIHKPETVGPFAISQNMHPTRMKCLIIREECSISLSVDDWVLYKPKYWGFIIIHHVNPEQKAGNMHPIKIAGPSYSPFCTSNKTSYSSFFTIWPWINTYKYHSDRDEHPFTTYFDWLVVWSHGILWLFIWEFHHLNCYSLHDFC